MSILFVIYCKFEQHQLWLFGLLTLLERRFQIYAPFSSKFTNSVWQIYTYWIIQLAVGIFRVFRQQAVGIFRVFCQQAVYSASMTTTCTLIKANLHNFWRRIRLFFKVLKLLKRKGIKRLFTISITRVITIELSIM